MDRGLERKRVQTLVPVAVSMWWVSEGQQCLETHIYLLITQPTSQQHIYRADIYCVFVCRRLLYIAVQWSNDNAVTLNDWQIHNKHDLPTDVQVWENIRFLLFCQTCCQNKSIIWSHINEFHGALAIIFMTNRRSQSSKFTNFRQLIQKYRFKCFV